MQAIFPDATTVHVVVPHAGAPDAELAETAQLLAREAAELTAEFGAPVTFTGDPDGTPRLEFRIDPALAVPRLTLARADQVLVAGGADLAGAVEALSLLRTMRRTGGTRVDARPATSVGSAVARLEAEVGSTYPAFALRDLDWAGLCDRYRDTVDHDDPLPGMQRLIARLGDAHTRVQPTTAIGHIDATARVVDGEVRFMRVPADGPAAAAGVRCGDVLLDVDVADLWARTGASAHLRPWYVGRLALAGPLGEPRPYRVRRADGDGVEFVDEPGSVARRPQVEVTATSHGTGYLRIRSWRPGVNDRIDAALHDLRACDRLVVDLRGNVGGSLVEATTFRDRFLDRPRRLGAIRFSSGDGGLTGPVSIDGRPADRPRWQGRTRFLTDALTYSASEDAMLGLRQLDHVDVAGEPSGGGSGRARTVRLLDDIRLYVSTALTYDHDGACIEGAGIPVDLPLELPPEAGAWVRADDRW